MRGSAMRRFTKLQHEEVLAQFPHNGAAAEEYERRSGKPVSRQLVAYWRRIFLDNKGNLSATDRQLAEQRVYIKPQPDDDIGPRINLPKVAKCILVIPDQHMPYHHKDMLKFLSAVKERYPEIDLVVNVGDEVDHHGLSFHDSDPNLNSAGMELEAARKTLNKLHDLFPQQLVCHSNHGSMAFRKAKAHGIPVQYIKRYRDVLFPEHGAPGWSWAHGWRVETPLGTVMFKHQSSGILTDAAHNQCNLVVGHSHGNFSIEYSASSAKLYWGMFVGCIIDKDAMAFAYGKHTLRKPMIGCAMIINGRPQLIPMHLNKAGRWDGSF